jgi:hypothetical protein
VTDYQQLGPFRITEKKKPILLIGAIRIGNQAGMLIKEHAPRFIE